LSVAVQIIAWVTDFEVTCNVTGGM